MTFCDFSLVPGSQADYRCATCERLMRDVRVLPIRAICRGSLKPGQSPPPPIAASRCGPGTELHDLLASIGLDEHTGCACRALRTKMDAWGLDGCETHRAEILDRLRAEARKLPIAQLLRSAARAGLRRLWLSPLDPAASLLNEALRRARRKPADLVFHLPPGIGDCSWVYSKIAALAETRPVAVRVSRSGLPRALDFVELLPRIDSLGWGLPFDPDRQFVAADADLSSLGPGEYHLFANPHLEAGRPLETLWPKQETRYHYAISTTPAMARRAEQILSGEGSGFRVQQALVSPRPGTPGRGVGGEGPNATRHTPLIGFYASSGNPDWAQQLWSDADWLTLIEGTAALYDRPTLVAVAALYDRRTIRLAKLLRARGHRVLECVGTHIGTTVEVIRRLDYFLAYPSGLGILGDVLDTPTLMFYWPDFHDPFIDTYADPKSIAAGRHLNLLFGRADDALRVLRDRLPVAGRAA